MINQNFQKEYQKLNPEQKEAVNLIEGPVMVIAGPGTGKTQILAMRIANILRKTQINPSNILCLTFTNSGVLAMRKRLLKILGVVSYQIHIHTFHSFCNEVINYYPEKFLIAKKLNQLTDLEEIIFIQKILDQENLHYLKPFKSPYYYQKAILNNIYKLKQEDISADIFAQKVKKEIDLLEKNPDIYHEKGKYQGQMKGEYKIKQNQLLRSSELAKVYKKYEKKLIEEGKYDYTDMILFVLNAFKEDPELLSIYQEKFQYILVDEYQDANSAQNKLVDILASFYEIPNIFVVGDDEQSIFRFQGASMENILSFSGKYPDTKIIVLKENYRSGKNILDASRGLISKNQNQIFNKLKIEKKLNSQIKHKGEINLAKFSSGKIEDYFVAEEVKKLIKKGIDPKEIAVFYRENRDVENLIEIFAKTNIPYRLEIGGDILEDPEIRKIINILKIISNNYENALVFEVLHYSFFKIDPLDIYKITQKANKNKRKIFDILTDEKQKNIKKFVEIILEAQKKSANTTFSETFEFIINSTGYLDYLLTTTDAIHHLNRLQILFEEIKNLNRRNKKLKIIDFLKYLDDLVENDLIIREKELEADFSGVNLMTAHKAKGLEFEVVFIIHLTDGHWGNKIKRELIKLPGNLLKLQNDIENNLEEERRLFYVGLTRAKKEIYLTYAENYSDEESASFNLPSQFLEELPKNLTTNIKTNAFEKAYEKRLKISFSEKKWHQTKELKEFIKKIIEEFSLSATSFNSYLECPKKFYYDHIIRVPKVKDFTQSYGTAVHYALEMLFLKFVRDRILPKKTEFIQFFIEGLDREIMTATEYKRMLNDGSETLKKYYDFYKNEWLKNGPPIALEYNFKNHNVHFENVPISGKIDKIELLDKLTNSVKITDYKTSKPKSLNEILGKTKNSDKNLIYQAYFYKLLSESDPLFRFKISEIEFDFIQADNEKFKKVLVPIDEKEYKEFKELVKKTYKNIARMDFASNSKSCEKTKGECEYSQLC